MFFLYIEPCWRMLLKLCNYGELWAVGLGDWLVKGSKQEEQGFTVCSKAPPFMRSSNASVDHNPRTVASHLHPSCYTWRMDPPQFVYTCCCTLSRREMKAYIFMALSLQFTTCLKVWAWLLHCQTKTKLTIISELIIWYLRISKDW